MCVCVVCVCVCVCVCCGVSVIVCSVAQGSVSCRFRRRNTGHRLRFETSASPSLEAQILLHGPELLSGDR